MMHIVTGGSGSGKSAYAESLITNVSANTPEKTPYLYIATMKPFGEETMRKIKRHQDLRAGKGFQTLECYKNLAKLEIPANEGILLECMSNLVAGELFSEEGTLNDYQKTRDAVLKGVDHLRENTAHLVIVTNEVTGDLQDYSEETKIYQKLLGEINQYLGKEGDAVTEVVYGIPVKIKEL